jgi:Reverse transcriptase (RNA-dependent DNA polymerase)
VAVRVDPIASRWHPKPGGGLRRMALLSERDHRAWSDLGQRVAGTIDAQLSDGVVAHRTRADGRWWTLEPAGAALRRARALVAGALAPVALRTDVTAFYPSVTPGLLFGSLQRLSVDAHDAATAADLLEGWGTEGYPGLPVGPPASAVLANAVLAPVDDALPPSGWLRWVDDYLVFLASERAAGVAVERIDHALDALGLSRSDQKTALVEGARLRWPGGRGSALD